MEGKSGRTPTGRVALPREHADIADAHAAIACLARLTALMERRRAQLAAGAGLTEQQCGVIEEIATEQFMPSLFARRRDSSPAAVSKILRQLGDKGLILTTVAERDGRQRRYSLTSKGRRALQRLREMREEAIRRVWLELDGAGMRAFTAFGERLAENLEAYASTRTRRRETWSDGGSP
jgi:DNA-binding MarR family transcriptional regulator